MAQRVLKAVLPVAGLATRFLPATKAMPKEMLTVIDRPLIQYAVEECLAAGIEEFVFVTGRNKSVLEDHFDSAYELEATLEQRGKAHELKQTQEATIKAGNAIFTRQQRPLGLGHAVWCARRWIGREPFAVVLPDELMIGSPTCTAQLVEVAGAGEALELDLNREIAHSSLAALEREAKSRAMTASIAQSRNYLLAGEAANASRPPDRKAAVRAFSLSAKTSLEAREQLVLVLAAKNIEINRKGDIVLTIIDDQGAPLAGMTVDFQQTANDFLFGVHPLGHAGRYDKAFGKEMHEAGFNASYVTVRWGRLEPVSGEFDWRNIDSDQSPLDKRQDGFSLIGSHGLWFSPNEDFIPHFLGATDFYTLRGAAKFATLREAIHRYAFLLAQRYTGIIDIWEVNELNLKSSNFYLLDWQQRISLGQTFTNAIKKGNYKAKLMFGSLALQYDAPNSPLPEMLDAGLLADIIGIELYQAGANSDGNRPIGLDLTAIDRLFNSYMVLGKPLLVKEFSAPSEHVDGSSWRHRRWDQDLQAEYASRVYAIAFSKPMMQGIVWAWGVSDAESFILHGGLLDKADVPKKAFFALQKLLASWRTKGRQTTNAAGQIAWRGFGGTYRVTGTRDGREVLEASIHLAEQEQSHIFLRIADQAPTTGK